MSLGMESNIELTNRLTLQRRPGLTSFSSTGFLSGFIYPTTPLTAYTFHLIDGTLRVMVDTGTTGPSEQDAVTAVAAPVAGLAVYTGTFTSGANNGLVGFNVTIAGMGNGANNGVFPVYFSTATTITVGNASAIAQTGQTATATTLYVTSVAASVGANAVYTGVFTNGTSNAFAGYRFTITGFGHGVNNGTFLCVASTGTTLTLMNANAIAETNVAAAVSSGAVYWDQQNGNATIIWGKGLGAGQTYFIASGGILFFADGVDTKKWTPYNLNMPPGSTVSVWNWGIVAPEVQPSFNIVASGAATQQWQASTVFSTMGITYVPGTGGNPGQVWQLIGVNASPNTDPNTTNATSGTSGSGGPASPGWNDAVTGNETAYGLTTDNTVTWKNVSWIQQWVASTVYGDAGVSGTASNVCVYDPETAALYLNFNGGGGLSRSGTVKPPFTAVVGWNFTEGHGAGGTVGGITYSEPHWFFFCTFVEALANPWLPSHVVPAWYGAFGGSEQLAAAVVQPAILPPPTAGVGTNPVTGQPNPPTPVFLQINNGASGTTGTNNGPFPAVPTQVGQQVIDNQLLWQCISSPSGAGSALTAAWAANFAFVPWTVSGGTFACIYDGVNLQVCVSTSGNLLSGAHEPGTVLATTVTTTVAPNTPSTGQATYTLNTGSWTFNPATGDLVKFAGFTNAGNNGTFSVVSSTNNTIVVSNAAAVIETHSQTTTWNPWGTAYGNTTNDGGLVWSCIGEPYGWTASTLWNLPLTGFAPPQQSQQYGGSAIDANGDVQTTIQSGKSGTVQPSWNGLHQDTTDGTSSPQLVWFAESVQSTNSLAFQKGYSYAYSYKARALNDIYSAPPLGGINGVQQIPPGIPRS